MLSCWALCISVGSLFILYNPLCIKIHFDVFVSIPAIFLPTTMLQYFCNILVQHSDVNMWDPYWEEVYSVKVREMVKCEDFEA